MQNVFVFFTESVFEILDNGSFPGTVFPLHIVGRHKARFVGGISNPPPGLGVVEEPEALIFLDVQLLVLLGHVVELGDDNHLFRHLAPGTLVVERERREEFQLIDEQKVFLLYNVIWPSVGLCAAAVAAIKLTSISTTYNDGDNMMAQFPL